MSPIFPSLRCPDEGELNGLFVVDLFSLPVDQSCACRLNTGLVLRVFLCRIECPGEINTTGEEEGLSLRKFIKDRDLRSEDSDDEDEDPVRESDGDEEWEDETTSDFRHE
jgi:hypothetical protein